MRAAAGARIPPGAGALLAALAFLQALEAAHEDEAPVAHLHHAFVAGRDVGVAGLGRFVSGTCFLFQRLRRDQMEGISTYVGSGGGHTDEAEAEGDVG